MAGKNAKKEPRKINKQELVSLMAEKSELTKAQTRKALNGVIEIIKEALAAGVSVSLVNFGSFKTVGKKARMGRNLQTGKTMKIKAKAVPKFVPGKSLKEAVK